MSEDLLIKYCSPTLAGLKTGSLFTCTYASRGEVLREIRSLNCALVPKGLRVLPLRYSENRVLIYVFRPAELAADLSAAEARRILQKAGYRNGCADQCILELIRRLNDRDGFPHEIGLFLSYPPEDVIGFIRNRGRRCKCEGCWKVYGDAAAAMARFSRFRSCTELYCRRWAQGASMRDLAVAI